VFGYSDEDGTEAATLSGKVRRGVVGRRLARLSGLVEELVAQRAAERVGEVVEILVESVADGVVEGRAEHQAPEVDGSTTLTGAPDVAVGDLVTARVVASEGVDLVAEASVPATAAS
jgi:tRNA A37 methylthiotransferase MiaB